MQLRRNLLLALCIVLFVYFEIHSCAKDAVTPPAPPAPVESILCSATQVFFEDAEFGMVTGALGTCIRTTDGGKTWTGSVIDDGSLNDVQFVDRLEGWVVGKDMALHKTTDGGATWSESQPNGFPVGEDFYRVAFFGGNVGYVLGYHGVYKTVDGGANWANNWLPNIQYRGAWGMSFPDESTGYLLGSRYTEPDPSILYRTKDGGASWLPVEGSKASALQTVLTICFVDELTGWAGGGVILKTEDGGETWRSQLASATVREMAFASKDLGFAVGGKTILRTRDGGLTWENVTPADARIKDLRGIHVLDANTVWVAGRGSDEEANGRLYKHSLLLSTTDGGATWAIRDFPYDFGALGSTAAGADL